MISLLLNVLWLVFGGIWMAAGWLLAALIMAITIIGIPFAVAAVRIAQYTLLPFGYTNVPRDRGGRPETIGTGPLGFLGQSRLAAARRLVAGPRPSDHRPRSRRHHHRPAFRLGASEARRPRPLAARPRDRQP